MDFPADCFGAFLLRNLRQTAQQITAQLQLLLPLRHLLQKQPPENFISRCGSSLTWTPLHTKRHLSFVGELIHGTCPCHRSVTCNTPNESSGDREMPYNGQFNSPSPALTNEMRKILVGWQLVVLESLLSFCSHNQSLLGARQAGVTCRLLCAPGKRGLLLYWPKAVVSLQLLSPAGQPGFGLVGFVPHPPLPAEAPSPFTAVPRLHTGLQYVLNACLLHSTYAIHSLASRTNAL